MPTRTSLLALRALRRRPRKQVQHARGGKGARGARAGERVRRCMRWKPESRWPRPVLVSAIEAAEHCRSTHRGRGSAPERAHCLGHNDSKQLTPAQRESSPLTSQTNAACSGITPTWSPHPRSMPWGWGWHFAMKRAIDDAGVDADAVLIDGNPVHVSPRRSRSSRAMMRVRASLNIVAVKARMLMVSLAEYPEYHLAECKATALRSTSPPYEHGLRPPAYLHETSSRHRSSSFPQVIAVRLACNSRHSSGFERLQRLWVLANPELPISFYAF